jgi:hypothetical protein
VTRAISVAKLPALVIDNDAGPRYRRLAHTSLPVPIDFESSHDRTRDESPHARPAIDDQAVGPIRVEENTRVEHIAIAIVWRGLGYLVAVIVFSSSLAANLISNAKYGAGYYDQNRWPFALSLAVSGVICWSLGNVLRKKADQIVADKQTGRELMVNRSQHTLFFIPMHWWGLILAATSVVLFVRG